MANEKYSLSKIGEKQEEHGTYYLYGNRPSEDPLNEFLQAEQHRPQAPKDEPKKAPPIKETQKRETASEELRRLEIAYYEKISKAKKANKIRWSITFCCFSVINFIVIMLYMGNSTITEVLQASLKDIGLAILLAIVLAAIYFIVNVSIFGWLIQKIIAADREAEPILKRIRELEKKVK